MNKKLHISLFVLFLVTPCMAQEIPGWEFFGGYSWERADLREYFKSSPIIYTFRNQYVSLNGWNVSFTENRNRWFGGTLDISGHYKGLNVFGTANRERRYSFLYGPRFSYRTSKAVLFVHTLVGLARANVRVTPTGPHDSAFSLAMAVGTGLDVNLGKKTAVRLFKAEYYWSDVFGTRQSSYRASTGVIFYWGKIK